jgi:Flp pilus assembly protein TadB
MTKQNILILLAPTGFFVLAALAILLMAGALFKHAAIDRSHQKKFAVFAANVQSGKSRLTVGQWLDTAHQQDEMIENYRQASISAGKMMQLAGWAIVAGIVFQIVCLFFVRNRSPGS